MRDLGLPEIGGPAGLRRGVAPVERVAAPRKVADQAAQTEAMASVAALDAGDRAPSEIADGIIAAGLFQSAGE